MPNRPTAATPHKPPPLLPPASTRQRLKLIQPASKTTRTPSIPAPFTNELFGAAHTDIAARMGAYRHRNYRNKVIVPDAVWDEMEPKNAKYLAANNIKARIEFAKIAGEVLSPFFLKETRPIFWITLTPRQYTLDFEDACEFDTMRLRQWVHAVLRGLHFVAMVEAGCFPVAHAHNSRIRVSYHVHLLGWGCSKAQLKQMKAALNQRWKSDVPGVAMMHAVNLPPSEAIKRVFYMSKAPLKSMRPVPSREVINWDTGEITTTRRWANKIAIRTGLFANMCIAMAGRDLTQLAFAGGEGAVLIREILDRALAPQRREAEQWEAQRRRVKAKNLPIRRG